MLPFFATLVTHTDEARRAFELNPVVLEAVANGMPLARYQRLLKELYHVVWHFNPVCAAAASRLGDEHRAVRYFLYEHMQEESGHEQWVMNDLEAVGVGPSALQAHAPSVHLLALNGYNYWAADRQHPCAVLGMMYVLEVIASVYGGTFSAAIRDSLLLQGNAGVSFISSHAEMDAQHMADLRVILNTVQGEAAQQAVTQAALFNFHHITQMIAAI
jgi:pyrroloquinoline quinone (PQQ) biosynthesis protein C